MRYDDVTDGSSHTIFLGEKDARRLGLGLDERHAGDAAQHGDADQLADVAPALPRPRTGDRRRPIRWTLKNRYPAWTTCRERRRTKSRSARSAARTTRHPLATARKLPLCPAARCLSAALAATIPAGRMFAFGDGSVRFMSAASARGRVAATRPSRRRQAARRLVNRNSRMNVYSRGYPAGDTVRAGRRLRRAASAVTPLCCGRRCEARLTKNCCCGRGWRQLDRLLAGADRRPRYNFRWLAWRGDWRGGRPGDWRHRRTASR